MKPLWLLWLPSVWATVMREGQAPHCPSPTQISPCTCGGPSSFPLFACERIPNLATLRHSFQAYFPLRTLGKLSLTNSELTSLDGTTLHVSFEYIYIHKTNIKSIDSGSLDASSEVVKRIEITHNDLEKFPFKNLKRYPHLEYLVLNYNDIKSVPDNALSDHSKLSKVDLSFNKISYVGSNAFKNMPELEHLDLRYNKLAVLNNLAFSSNWFSPRYQIDLSHNKILKLADDTFYQVVPSVLNMTYNHLREFPEQQFGDMLSRMATRGAGLVMVSHNRFRCTCEGVRWLVELPWTFKRHVVGFQCNELKRPLEELTLSDVGCGMIY